MCHCSVPYNAKTLVGHVYTHLTEFLGVSSLVAVLSALSTLFYGVCAYAQTLFSDLTRHFTNIDGKLRTEGIHHTKLKLELIKIVELHNNIYR